MEMPEKVGSCKEKFTFPWDQKTETMQKGNASLCLSGMDLYNTECSECQARLGTYPLKNVNKDKC